MELKQEIIKCEETLLEAMRTADLATLDKLISDDLIFNVPDGSMITKQMDLDAYKSGNMVLETMDCVDREIQVSGDTAVVSTQVFMKGYFMQQPMEGRTRFFRTWKKVDGNWQIIGGASIFIG
ncbi:nuclear transport factor 2 family protein [Dysgonomonas macrotermitis]|uniref:DUF4440 domain-containing protein n=1 Tax=Dysgonomonas macrotermitis TaxID=1346286 RepID=A0A1M5FRC8_9BACT|nr:nuclear transport factor 2 family protein [Dysgonomonas macrotermitis]SHF94046.1 protein of unknown function [Dysgonomonas macrotermitis]